MCAGLCLSDSSPAVKSSTGVIISCTEREIMTPSVVVDEPVTVIDFTHYTLKYKATDRGQDICLVLPSGEEITSFRDRRLDGVRLKMKTFGDIPYDQVEFITNAIIYGRLSVEATDHQYTYDVNYILDNSKPIYTDDQVKTQIVSLLSAKAGEYLNIIFPDTTYAVKKYRNRKGILMQTSFIFPLRKIRTNEVITGIYDRSKAPPEFSINNGDQFGIGIDGNYTPVTAFPKLSAEVNMNNYIPLYTSIVEFEGTPVVGATPPGYV